MRNQRREKRVEEHASMCVCVGGGESPLTPLFICPPTPTPRPPTLAPGLPYVNWASQECCLFYLRFSLWSLDLPLSFLLFLPAFPFLVF